MRRILILTLILAGCSVVDSARPDGVLDCHRITEWKLASMPVEGHGTDNAQSALIKALSHQQADRGGSVFMLSETTASLLVRGRELAVAEALPHAGGGWFGVVTSECDP